MDYDFVVAWCPYCNQGYAQIRKDTINGQLLVLCTECDTVWLNPADIEIDNPVKDHLFEGLALRPSEYEVDAIGWTKFLKDI